MKKKKKLPKGSGILDQIKNSDMKPYEKGSLTKEKLDEAIMEALTGYVNPTDDMSEEEARKFQKHLEELYIFGKTYIKWEDPKARIDSLKMSEWYLKLPQIIKDAIEIIDPTKLYKFKDSGKQCHVISYDEPESNKLEDVTVTVQKTGKGGAMASMGLGVLDTNQVFGVKLTNLILWKDEDNR